MKDLKSVAAAIRNARKPKKRPMNLVMRWSKKPKVYLCLEYARPGPRASAKTFMSSQQYARRSNGLRAARGACERHRFNFIDLTAK